jgi:HEAT repeat protein
LTDNGDGIYSAVTSAEGGAEMPGVTKRKQAARESAALRRRQVATEYGMEQIPSATLTDWLGDADPWVVAAANEVLFGRGKAALDALVTGLSHDHAKVRAACALLMDHLGDDRCTEPLKRMLKHDRIEAVRRSALHSLACQDCKVCPLTGDTLGPLIDAALTDRSLGVRRRAIQYLVGQKRDARVAEAARMILTDEKDAILLRRAQRALDWHLSDAPQAPCAS